MTRFITLVLAAIMVTALAAPASAKPGTFSDGPAIFAGGEMFRTKDAADLPEPTGNNIHSFDEIYVFPEGAAAGQLPVAEAAPGEAGFNGGRWAVRPVAWADGSTPTLLTSSQQLHDLVATGEIVYLTDHPIRYFECPLVPYRG